MQRELINKRICNRSFNWNPKNSECECNKSCDVWKYLDYKNCKCRKSLVDKPVEKCSESIDDNNVCCIFHNNHKHYQCFYSFSVIIKRKILKQLYVNILNATMVNI